MLSKCNSIIEKKEMSVNMKTKIYKTISYLLDLGFPSWCCVEFCCLSARRFASNCVHLENCLTCRLTNASTAAGTLCYITCSHSRQTVHLTARETTTPEDAAQIQPQTTEFYIVSTLLYGSETWVMLDKHKSRMSSSEMKYLRIEGKKKERLEYEI